MKMTGAEAIIKSLEMEKVNIVFGYPGAAICPFYDALQGSSIRHVLTRHEQGAVHAASGYARVTGKTGVCVSTSGPGATNLITGIATAYMDSIPVVAITGQVSSELIGRDVFQEADITGATAPFCKHSYLVRTPHELPRIIKESFHIASTGRPGPVLIDIPIDVQCGKTEFKYPDNVDIRGYKPNYRGHVMQIKKIANVVSQAKRPVICAGGGIISACASEELLKLAQMCRIPVVTTLMGIGSISSEHELYMGMLGSHGVYSANYALHNADLLLIFGARVGDRAIASTSVIAKNAVIVHVDIDPAEIGKNINVSIPVVGDIKAVINDIIEIIKPGDAADWLAQLQKVKMEHGGSDKYNINTDKINPKYFMNRLSSYMQKNVIVTTEVGQNQIWAANHLKVKTARSFITSGGMGTMGYGLPAAIGAKIGCPDSTVIVISGDGSFQMSMQELGTIKQENIGVKIIIFNNSRLGMVRELQKTKYGSRYTQVFLDDNPDFGKIADAYGFNSSRICSNSEIDEGISKMLVDDKPFILECIVDPEESTI